MRLSDFSPQQLRDAADLKERIDALEAELNELLSVTDDATAQAPVRPRVARRPAPATRSRPESHTQLTIQAAVLKALESGEPLSKNEIVRRVSALRGEKANADSIRLRLYEMKSKDKTITSPRSGFYQLRYRGRPAGDRLTAWASQ
jgi:hypothetical protein